MNKLLIELYFRIRWEGYKVRLLATNIHLDYTPPRKGKTKWHASTFDAYVARGFIVHIAGAVIGVWRYYPERDTSKMTVGQRGAW